MLKQKYLIILLLISLSVAGCKSAAKSQGQTPASNANAAKKQADTNNSPSTPGAADSGSAKNAAQPPAPAAGDNPPKLVGTYTITEVETRGVINMISNVKTVM